MYQGNFEMFDVKARRLRSGHKLSIILESEDNLDEEKALIEYRGDDVKASMTFDNDKETIVLEGVFEVYDITHRRLKNGNKLRVILESLYDKEKEIEAVMMRYETVKLEMEKTQLQLGLEVVK